MEFRGELVASGQPPREAVLEHAIGSDEWRLGSGTVPGSAGWAG